MVITLLILILVMSIANFIATFYHPRGETPIKPPKEKFSFIPHDLSPLDFAKKRVSNAKFDPIFITEERAAQVENEDVKD